MGKSIVIIQEKIRSNEGLDGGGGRERVTDRGGKDGKLNGIRRRESWQKDVEQLNLTAMKNSGLRTQVRCS